MTINVVQAALLGLCACLSSMPGLGGTVFGNYTLGRPLIGGLVVGLILGNVPMGIMLGAAVQIVYIALVTPGGTISADVRAISYIGLPLAMLYVSSTGLDPASAEAGGFAVSMAATVGTLGTVLFYGTATINLVWQHMGMAWVKQGKLKKLYLVDLVLPWISHFICSFIPTFIICYFGSDMVQIIKDYLPMDGLAMKTLFTVGSLLPAVGVAILLKQVVSKPKDFLTFFVGFTLCACMGLNLIGCAIIGGFFALIQYNIRTLSLRPATVAVGAGDDDDDEEDI